MERLFLIQLISYDWNCPQYITPRFTAAEVEEYAGPLKARIAELEAQLAARDDPEHGKPSATQPSEEQWLPGTSAAIDADNLAVNEGPRGRGQQ